MTSNRAIELIITAPQKGDKVELGDISLLVKEVFKKKGESMLKVRFRGENGVTKQWKAVRMETWEDQLRYLIRVDKRQCKEIKEEYGDDLVY